MFLRGKPHLAHQMKRVKIKGTGPRKPASPGKEPNFYLREALPLSSSKPIIMKKAGGSQAATMNTPTLTPQKQQQQSPVSSISSLLSTWPSISSQSPGSVGRRQRLLLASTLSNSPGVVSSNNSFPVLSSSTLLLEAQRARADAVLRQAQQQREENALNRERLALLMNAHGGLPVSPASVMANMPSPLLASPSITEALLIRHRQQQQQEQRNLLLALVGRKDCLPSSLPF